LRGVPFRTARPPPGSQTKARPHQGPLASPHDPQAAAEGDASKVAKGRGKGGGGKSKEDAALDALFLVDEEDDGDYQPGQDDSGGLALVMHQNVSKWEGSNPL
jgi:hypothetical protein